MRNQQTSNSVFHPLVAENEPDAVTNNGEVRSLRWRRWDVTIDNVLTSPSRFDVTEDQHILIEQGTFLRFYRTIALSHLVSIENIRVYEDDVPLTQGTGNEAGTFTLSIQGPSEKIAAVSNYQKIMLSLRSPADAGDSRHIRLTYTVNGALRSYQSGDQLIWPALPTHRDYLISNATVRVTMPQYRPARRIASISNTWKSSRSENTVTWKSPRGVSKLNGFELRIEYDHDAQMQAPPWQGTLMKKPLRTSTSSRLGCLMFVAAVLACLGLIFGGTFLHGYDSCMGVEGGTFFGCVGYGVHVIGAGGSYGGSSYVSTGNDSSSSSSYTSSSSDGSYSNSSSDSSSSDSGGDSGDSGGDGGDGGGD